MMVVGPALCHVDTCEQSLCMQTNACHYEHYHRASRPPSVEVERAPLELVLAEVEASCDGYEPGCVLCQAARKLREALWMPELRFAAPDGVPSTRQQDEQSGNQEPHP